MKNRHKLLFLIYKTFILNSKIRWWLKNDKMEYENTISNLKVYLIKDLRYGWFKPIGLRAIKSLIDPLFGKIHED